MPRKAFIGNTPLAEALSLFLSRAAIPPAEEEIPVIEAAGRVTSRMVFARASSPAYTAAAMDGIAVRAAETATASDASPLDLAEGAGFTYVNTGAPIPEGFDAVVMIEDVQEFPGGIARIRAAAYPWQHVRPVGEDIAAFDLVLPANRLVRGEYIGALVSSGASSAPVWKRPSVCILPTGNEIVREVSALGKGKILDSNSPMFAALVAECHGLPFVLPVCPDDPAKIRAAVEAALESCDALLVGAGSSAGERDHTADVLASLGEVLVHGIAIRPGKPAILAVVKGKPVIGVPGYPVSSALVFELFAKPLLLAAQKLPMPKPDTLQATLVRRLFSSFKHEEFVRVQVGYVGGKFLALPLARGAGSSITLAKADGIVRIPRESEGMEAGETVNVHLTAGLREIEHRLVIAGSHDLSIDLLADRVPLVSSHSGSLGGLVALSKNECHLAPIHLLDPETGTYNHACQKPFFPMGDVLLVRGFLRTQGFMVRKGNPKRILSYDDLARPDVTFLNRQRGSGTRVLLDFELARRGIDPAKINGYGRELATHTAVAAGVAGGGADAALGIMGAALSMGLDFVPAGEEHYDFVLRADSLPLPEVRRFIETLQDSSFRRSVEALGGYDASRAGETEEV